MSLRISPVVKPDPARDGTQPMTQMKEDGLNSNATMLMAWVTRLISFPLAHGTEMAVKPNGGAPSYLAYLTLRRIALLLYVNVCRVSGCQVLLCHNSFKLF